MPEPVRIGRLPLFTRPPATVNNPDKQSVPFNADFQSEQTYIINLAQQQGQRLYGLPQSVKIDNGNNPNNITIMCEGTKFSLVVPAYANAILPLDAQENDTLTFYSLGGTPADAPLVSISIYNYPQAAAVWYTTDPLAPGFQVEVIEPTATSIVNRNTLLVAGVAANVFPAVASPRNLVFRNMTNEEAWYRINGVATASFANSFQIDPGQEIALNFRTPWALSMLSPNGGQIQAYEWASS